MRSHLENGTVVSSTPRGPSAEALENAQDAMGPCFASNEGSCFKENMNVNKFETPKLAVEPLQMKKKRKSGGFNLRKSLAWDRAFFTEEGVLDPQELSFISGASCEEGLSFVNEHTPVGSRLPNKPVGRPKLSNSIFKKLQTEDLGKDTKADGSSLMLDSSSSNSISTSVTSNKVPTLVGCKISGSRCSDIPRPLSSSSLKRPANVNVGRAPGKESKQLKVPCLKPGFSPNSTTTKKTISRVNHVKQNQITQRGLKSSCESPKTIQNASKSLQSALFSDGNSGNSSYRGDSSINMQSVLVDKSGNLGTNMITPVRPVYVSEGRHEFSTFAAPLSQNPHLSSGTMQPSQNQVLKPSGLRMPSPSLSFFSQHKPPVSCDPSLRGTGTDAHGFPRYENSRLKANLRKPELDNNILQITIQSKDISSRSVCTPSSHVSAVQSIKPIIELAPMLKIQDYSEKHRIEKIALTEVAELQSINNEMPSQSKVEEQVLNELFLKNESDGYRENHQSCKSRWENSKLQSEQRPAILEAETISAIDGSSKEKNTCNLLFLNHGTIVGTQCEDSLDHRVQDSLTNQSDGEDASNCHGPQSSDTENTKYPLGQRHKHKNFSKSRGREQLSVSTQNGGWCSQSGEALECKISKSVDSYLGLKDLQADLSKEASVGVLVDNLFAGQSGEQSAVCNSNIGECENNINLISKVDADAEQTGKCSAVKINYPEAGQKLQICLEEQNIEKLTFVSPDRKNGSNVSGTKMASSSSPDKEHECDLDKDKIGEQTLSSTCFGSVDSSVPLVHNDVTNNTFSWGGKHEADSNCIRNDPAYHDLSNSLHKGVQQTELDFFSASTVIRTHEFSSENTPGKVAEVESVLQDGSTKNQLTLSTSLKDNECDLDNLINVQKSGTELVQPPESSTLNESCFKHSDYLTLPHAKFGSENIVPGVVVGSHFENCLETKTPANELRKENELWSQENPIIGQSKINSTIFESPIITAQEKPICNGKYETCDESHFSDSLTDPERVRSLSNTANSEASNDNSSISSCIYLKLDDIKVETTLAPVDMHEDDLSEKSCSSALPQNAIPFSDEWFAAIEAAGEDILTMKSGAVQNSPPDKPIPEPSPWSPVKKRNNQIGPFDCTKFNNNLPSDSN